MAVIDGTEFCCSSRMTMMVMTGCSIRWWIQGIVVLLLVVRGEFSSTTAATAAAAAGKCDLARVAFRNRGLETLLPNLQDNVTNGKCLFCGCCYFYIFIVVSDSGFFCGCYSTICALFLFAQFFVHVYIVILTVTFQSI